jgi:hypothetical protein
LVKVTIEQLSDFAGGAWFPNFVQRSRNMLAQMTIRVWGLGLNTNGAIQNSGH